MIRVSSMVVATAGALSPSVMGGTRTSANTKTIAARTARTASIRVRIVDTTRHARCSSWVARRAAMTGTRAELRAPAATSWNRKSGMRNAAKNASSWATSGIAPLMNT